MVSFVVDDSKFFGVWFINTFIGIVHQIDIVDNLFPLNLINVWIRKLQSNMNLFGVLAIHTCVDS